MKNRSLKIKEVGFAEKLIHLRENKSEIYAQMKVQAEESETIAYYKSKDISEIDLEIFACDSSF